MDNLDNAHLVRNMDRLIDDLNALPMQAHGVALTVWYSSNDGYWKWSNQP